MTSPVPLAVDQFRQSRVNEHYEIFFAISIVDEPDSTMPDCVEDKDAGGRRAPSYPKVWSLKWYIDSCTAVDSSARFDSFALLR